MVVGPSEVSFLGRFSAMGSGSVWSVGWLVRMGWTAKIRIEDGLRETYEWFLKHQGGFRI
jgi:nucleoside-diphosphate-sugar epimerase